MDCTEAIVRLVELLRSGQAWSNWMELAKCLFKAGQCVLDMLSKDGALPMASASEMDELQTSLETFILDADAKPAADKLIDPETILVIARLILDLIRQWRNRLGDGLPYAQQRDHQNQAFQRKSPPRHRSNPPTGSGCAAAGAPGCVDSLPPHS